MRSKGWGDCCVCLWAESVPILPKLCPLTDIQNDLIAMYKLQVNKRDLYVLQKRPIMDFKAGQDLMM